MLCGKGHDLNLTEENLNQDVKATNVKGFKFPTPCITASSHRSLRPLTWMPAPSGTEILQAQFK